MSIDQQPAPEVGDWVRTNPIVHFGDDVAALVGQMRMQAWPDEDRLQQHLFDALVEAGVPAVREYRLDAASRLDLFIPTIEVHGRPHLRPKGVAVEVKIHGSASAVLRQLARYARSEEVIDLVLVTTVASHTQLPKTVDFTPLFVVPLLEGGL